MPRLNTKCAKPQAALLPRTLLSHNPCPAPTHWAGQSVSKQLEFNRVTVSLCPYQVLGYLRDPPPGPHTFRSLPRAKPPSSHVLPQNWEWAWFPAPTPDSQNLKLSQEGPQNPGTEQISLVTLIIGNLRSNQGAHLPYLSDGELRPRAMN